MKRLNRFHLLGRLVLSFFLCLLLSGCQVNSESVPPEPFPIPANDSAPPSVPAEWPASPSLPSSIAFSESPSVPSFTEASSSTAPPPSPQDTPLPADNNTKLYVLMYHSFVEDNTECSDWSTTVSCFREDLQWLTDQGYQFVLPSELSAGTPLPEKAVMLTFDDGYADNYTLAFPLLKEYNAKAAISLVVSLVEEERPSFLTWDMCQVMVDSGLVEFGSHTYSLHEHDKAFGTYGIQRRPHEDRQSYEARVLPDLQSSIELIQENLSRPVIFFTYPHGKKDSWSAPFIQEHFSITLITQNGCCDISNGLYSLFRYNISTTSRPYMYLK